MAVLFLPATFSSLSAPHQGLRISSDTASPPRTPSEGRGPSLLLLDLPSPLCIPLPTRECHSKFFSVHCTARGTPADVDSLPGKSAPKASRGIVPQAQRALPGVILFVDIGSPLNPAESVARSILASLRHSMRVR